MGKSNEAFPFILGFETSRKIKNTVSSVEKDNLDSELDSHFEEKCTLELQIQKMVIKSFFDNLPFMRQYQKLIDANLRYFKSN